MVASVNNPSASAAPIVICGQGLAGTLLAWALIQRGVSVRLIDEDAAVTSSKIAAGIITPITGKRLTARPSLADFLPEAQLCYAATATQLGRAHFHSTDQVRLFQNEAESDLFARKHHQPEFAVHFKSSLGLGARLVSASLFHGNGTGFTMTTGGWLDTRSWLADSAAWFAQRGLRQSVTLAPESFVPDPTGVRLPDGTRAAAVVFCEGHAGQRNPWFPWVHWKCAKGEILTLKAPALAGECRIINHGGWLLPVDGHGTFRTGSTYDWKTLDTAPTGAGRELLEGRLHRLLRVPWEVIGQEAAVRPIIHESLARMGRHPVHPTLVFFNGLGSKGVLHGPRYARVLADHLVYGTPLPPEVDVARNG